jgi:uncharacterized repeat protein (TIGR01451 family)
MKYLIRTYDVLRHAMSRVAQGAMAKLRLRAGIALLSSAIVFIILFSPKVIFAAPPGTIISNTAAATYTDGPSSLSVVRNSNTVVVTTVAARTPATIELLQYAPASPTAQLVLVSPTSYSTSGTLLGPFAALGPPVPAGSGTPLNLSSPVPLVLASQYHTGEPVFVRVTDLDQNLNPAVAETVLVTMRDSLTGDIEVIRIMETGPNTGIFTGYIQTGGQAATTGNGVLSVLSGSQVTGIYVDAVDPTDSRSASVMVDPYGKVISSATGQPLDGVSVTLIDASTNLPATVRGDDGVSTFPATVTTGGTLSDSSGRVYSFPPGEYRFPFMSPGSYRIQVTPPTGYRFPSTASTASIQALPGAPFSIVLGSRGEVFPVAAGPAIHIDLPLDLMGNRLYLMKNVSKTTAAIGDFLQYKLSVQNTDTTAAVAGVVVIDRLPLGFRYRKGSLKINGAVAGTPSLSQDGRTLTVSVGDILPSGQADISYVTEVSAGAKLGKAVNSAIAAGAGTTSNTATATVFVKEDLFGSKAIIMGSIMVDGCGKTEAAEKGGLEGARIFLEDGTYVVTDKNGRYHFEGVSPGTHVVQVDLASLPKKYEIVACEEHSRFAGSAFSQFVDVQGGTLWRADFHAALKPRATGRVEFELHSELLQGMVGRQNTIAYRIPIRVADVPLRNARVTVMLPEGAMYQTGSSRLKTNPQSEPLTMQGSLTFRLGDLAAGWEDALQFDAVVPVEGNAVELTSKALLTFDTPKTKEERSPIAEAVLQARRKTVIGPGNDMSSSGTKTAATQGLRPGEQWDAPAAVKQPALNGNKMPEYTKAWIEEAEQGFAWLWPGEGYYPPIPATKIAIKHDPSLKLKLFLNNDEVSALYLDGMLKRQDGKVAVTIWRGVPLLEGDNRLEAVEYDEQGTERARLARTLHYSGAPVKAELALGTSKLIADGKNPPVVAVRFTDKEGKPAREGVIIEYMIAPPHIPRQRAEDFQKRPLSASTSERLRCEVGENGIALIELQPTTRTGEAVLRFPLETGTKEIRAWLKPEIRDWILVGLAEGTVGYNVVTGNMESLGASGQDDKLYQDNRVAFYAKGAIKGEWLLTIAYDSSKRRIRDQGSLYQTIDPNKYYTLYGDATEQRYDAASARAIYLKIERDQFYALFGDYDTGLTVTELSRYSRQFNGLKSEMKSEHFDYTLYASQSDQSFIKDEIPGDGTSGLYRLSRKNIVINSESVVIETRDRFRSEVILSSQPMARSLDYTIDYDAGAIWFKSPIFHRDENFNPIFIVVRYEYLNTSGGSINYGGMGAVRFLDNKVEIGATHVHEDSGDLSGNLTGVDTTVKLDAYTKLKAEFAATRTDLQTGGSNSGNAYLAELSRRTEQLEGKAYYRELQPGFGLGQLNNSETGSRKIGLDLRYRLSPSFTLSTELYRQENLTVDAVRDMAELQAKYTSKKYELFGGLRYAQDTLTDGQRFASDQIFAGGRYQVTDRLSATLRHDQSLGNENASSDFPTRTTLGIDYRLSTTATIFANQELTYGAQLDTNTTRIGIRAAPWTGGQVSSTMENQSLENGERLFSTLGLKQSWQVNKRWTLDAGLDRSQTLSQSTNSAQQTTASTSPFSSSVPPASGGEDFTAISLGAGYKADIWSWTGRVEKRFGSGENKLGVLSGVHGEFEEGVGVAAGVQVFQSDTSVGSRTTNGDGRIGFVYRPLHGDWIVLDRFDVLVDNRRDGVFNYDSWRVVNNLNANYKVNTRMQLSLQYAGKYVLETIDELDYRGYTDLIGLEVRYDITKTWDIGTRGMLLHSWETRQLKYGAGLSVGYNFMKNMLVRVGYNFVGFKDRDFSKADFTSEGFYLKFSLKLDQSTARNAAVWLTGL